MTTIEQLHEWLESIDCEVRRDLGNDEDIIMWWYWIETKGDRTVGIFPTQISPEFLTESALLEWANANQKEVEQSVLVG
jgi:hypothetical protein